MSLVRLRAIWMTSLAILLQCFDTAGWVIWPVKISSPKWLKLCRVEWDVKLCSMLLISAFQLSDTLLPDWLCILLIYSCQLKHVSLSYTRWLISKCTWQPDFIDIHSIKQSWNYRVVQKKWHTFSSTSINITIVKKLHFLHGNTTCLQRKT